MFDKMLHGAIRISHIHNQVGGKRRSFTLVELLTTIAIVAILSVALVFFAMGYITWSQNTTDQRTLLTLNDALTRYKCEGGSIAALTNGAGSGHVLTALEAPSSWAGGLSHQFLNAAFTMAARSLSQQGDGAVFRFTRVNSYDALANGTDSKIPATFGGEIIRINSGGFVANDYIITLPSAVPAGCRLVMAIQRNAAVTTMTDSKGNTWGQDVNASNLQIYSCFVRNALSAGDTITIAKDGAFSRSYMGVLVFINNASTVVTSSTYASVYTNQVTLPATVTKAPTSCFGFADIAATSYTSASWTQSGSSVFYGGTVYQYYFYSNETTTGSKDPNVVLSAPTGVNMGWVSYY